MKSYASDDVYVMESYKTYQQIKQQDKTRKLRNSILQVTRKRTKAVNECLSEGYKIYIGIWPNESVFSIKNGNTLLTIPITNDSPDYASDYIIMLHNVNLVLLGMMNRLEVPAFADILSPLVQNYAKESLKQKMDMIAKGYDVVISIKRMQNIKKTILREIEKKSEKNQEKNGFDNFNYVRILE